jgi:hypothetical protein
LHLLFNQPVVAAAEDFSDKVLQHGMPEVPVSK